MTKTAKSVTDKKLEPHISSVSDGSNSDEPVDIEKLRKDEKLKSKAKKILKKLVLTDETSSSESGSEGEQQSDVSYFFDDDSEAKNKKVKIKSKRKNQEYMQKPQLGSSFLNDGLRLIYSLSM